MKKNAKGLKVQLAEILVNCEYAIDQMRKKGVRTLGDALKMGELDLNIIRGVGQCMIDEIEVAALRYGYSFHTTDPKQIQGAHALVARYGTNHPLYIPGKPAHFRGDLTIPQAHLFARIAMEEGLKFRRRS